MSAIALQALADETGGQLVGDSVALQTLVIDSREVEDGDLFAALSGQRVMVLLLRPRRWRRGHQHCLPSACWRACHPSWWLPTSWKLPGALVLSKGRHSRAT